MRTTLDLDEDILQAAKELAAMQNTTAGKVLSDLARAALSARHDRKITVRNGVPLFPSRPGAGVMTVKMVKDLLDDE